jgi:hypothetical protein
VLYAALTISGILLVIANVAAARSAKPTLTILITGGFLTILPCIGFFITAATPLLTVVFCLLLRFPRSRFLPLSCVSFVLVFLSLAIPAFLAERDYSELRRRFPFESIEDRLPLQTPEFTAAPIDETQHARLEEEIEEEARKWGNYYPRRGYQLEVLHERTVRLFVNSPSFGAARMMYVHPTEQKVTDRLRDEKPIPQPMIPGGKSNSIDKPAQVAAPSKSDDLIRFNQTSIVDFVHPAGWGYVKDRQHIAGFQAHQFSKVPEPVGGLRVATVELIGWLHGEPAVYVSENLPSMKELRGVPTRPLDPFEEEGLAELRRGKDLFTREADGSLRMLGAIRATKQCLDCHGGRRGDLLGAFSYVLR